MALTDLQLTHTAFDIWLAAEGEDNRADLEKLKRYLPIVLEECVTPVQKEYITRYFYDGLNIVQIAEQYDVNASTVSRTIRRGMKRAYGYPRFLSPLLINAPQKRGHLRRNQK